MTDQSQHCVECERLAGELAAMRADLEETRQEWFKSGDKIRAMRAELEQMRDAFEGMNLARDDEQRQRVEVEAELDGYHNGNRDLHEENQALRAELELMKPVVEAAVANAHPSRRDGNGVLHVGPTLLNAVDAYRNNKEQA